MRLPPAVYQCAVFICAERTDETGIAITKPIATGVVVGVPIAENAVAAYVVTARHVLEGDFNAPLFIRVNTKNGASTYIQADPERWLRSDNADLAAIPFVLRDEYDVRYFPASSSVGYGPRYEYLLVTALADGPVVKHSRTVQMTTGDEIVIIGLFLDDYGEGANLPICRYGHIARMPSNVSTPRWEGDQFKSNAYLIECLSWAGLSGSPAFAVTEWTEAKKLDDDLTITNKGYFPVFLGIVNNHIDRPRKADTTGDLPGDIRYQLNTGIARVTPACAVIDLLNHELFADERRKFAAGLQMSNGGNVVLDDGVLRGVNANRPLKGSDLRHAWKKLANPSPPPKSKEE